MSNTFKYIVKNWKSWVIILVLSSSIVGIAIYLIENVDISFPIKPKEKTKINSDNNDKKEINKKYDEWHKKVYDELISPEPFDESKSIPFHF